jgi:hypothetical protein
MMEGHLLTGMAMTQGHTLATRIDMVAGHTLTGVHILRRMTAGIHIRVRPPLILVPYSLCSWDPSCRAIERSA